MEVLRNIFVLFIVAVAFVILNGCAAIGGMAVAMSSDPIDTQAQRDVCETGVSEQDEHYHKTSTSVKHTSKVVCK